MDTIDIIGTIGAGLILIGFVARKSKTYGIGTVIYQDLNIFGAGILIWYGWVNGVWPFVILNIIWLADALRALMSNKKRRNDIR
jgi:hypothetical protein